MLSYYKPKVYHMYLNLYSLFIGATLQQSSNIFYQKFVEIDSVGGCGEEKGFKGKGNRRSRRSLSASSGHSLAPLRGLASRKIFRAENKKQKEDTLGPTHPSAPARNELP